MQWCIVLLKLTLTLNFYYPIHLPDIYIHEYNKCKNSNTLAVTPSSNYMTVSFFLRV